MEHRHPAALPVLFLTEMWERFGFYIVQGLLILYMSHVFGFSDSKGYDILGAYTALAWIAPVFGGFVADQILGYRNTILLGNILLAVGYALVAIPGQNFFYPGLAIAVAGTGFFKPNISSFLGTFYHKEDSSRESGFTIFYIGINLGVLLATTSSGFIQQKFGWNVSFATASIGLLVGLITFIVGLKRIKYQTQPQKITKDNVFKHFLAQKKGLFTATLLLILLSWLFIAHGRAANLVLWVGSLILVIALVFHSFKYGSSARNKLVALILLTATSVVFWAIFYQMFFSLNLFIDRLVDRQWFGHEIPTVMFIGLESLFIFLLGPIFAWLWKSLNVKKINPSYATKFALATFTVGIGFVLIIVGIHLSPYNLVNPLWIVLAYFFVTIGELLLSPVGLAMVTVLAPANLVGMMMGVWFVALGLGGKLAGILAELSSIPQNVTDPAQMIVYYDHAFKEYAVLAIGASLVIFLLIPILTTMSQGEQPSLKRVFRFKD